MNKDYREKLNEILEEFGGKLDITKEEYDKAVSSYQDVGKWLSSENSSIYKYNPEILPQGSFMLGTMIRPINDEDDLDIDLVCKLNSIPNNWKQIDLKNSVGDRIKENGRYNRILKEQDGGRRCWTLKYEREEGFHLDILPSVADEGYSTKLNESFSIDVNLDNVDDLAIRITDNEDDNFEKLVPLDDWHKSNPFGYAKWFFKHAYLDSTKMFSLNESIQPVKLYEESKLPLQRVVQLLKRHRDIMFKDDEYDIEDKPISIIITTLATRAYSQERNIIEALNNVVNKLDEYIIDKYNSKTGLYEKWVENPVNEEENFADKWGDAERKQEYFYLWIEELKKDVNDILSSESKGYMALNESFSKQFGNDLSSKVFSNLAKRTRTERDNGVLKMATGSGILGNVGTKVKKHGFYGKAKEE